MVRIVIASFICFLLMACSAQQSSGKKNTSVKQLKVTGTQLTDISGNAVVLHGVRFCWHNWWPRFYNAGAVKELKENFNVKVVRAAMGIEPPKGYLKDPAFSEEKITAVIDDAIVNDLYVIVDWHSHNIQTKEAVAFFSKMAKKYGSYPNLIWETFNEPDKETWPEVKAYSIEVIKAIRQYDPDNIILVGSPQWDQAVDLPAADPITGYNNLMYTMHFYAGTHKQWLRDKTDAAMEKGLPIFVSECAGMEATGDGPIDEVEWKKYTDWMAEKKISWVAWSIADKNESCSMLLPAAASDGSWMDDVIKPWAKIVRESLKSAK